MAKFATVEEAIRYNSSKTCKVKGCNQQRYRVSGYCMSHNKRSSTTGSPTLGNIYPYSNLYERERLIARKLIEHNKDTHKGVRYALNFFDQIIANVHDGRPHNGLTSLAVESIANQIIKVNLQSEDMLEIAAAYYAYAASETTLLTDNKYFNTQLGNQLLKSVRHVAYPSGRDKRVLSDYIQKQLGLILVNLSEGILKRMRQEDTVIDMQKEILDINF